MNHQSREGSDGAFGTDAAAGLTLTDDDQLESSIVALKEQIDAAQADLALRIAEYDRRRLAENRHVLSTKQWLRWRCRMPQRTASAIVRFGRVLETEPVLRAAVLAGTVPVESARAMASLAERRPAAFAEYGAVLVEASTQLTPREMRQAIDRWEQHVVDDHGVSEVGDRHERRRLSVSQTFDGMWALTGDLDPESGHTVSMTIRAIADPGNVDPLDRRSPAQRRADALTEACRFWLDHNDDAITSAGVKPHITVTVAYDQLVASVQGDRPPDIIDGAGGVLPEIGGVAVSGEDVRRLACDADVVRIVVDGASEILDVGRATRTVPSAIRRALDHRDRGCVWDGCDAPSAWCDAHHVEHWADGGPTSLANLRLYCRRHHRAIHDGVAMQRGRAGGRRPDP